MAERFVIPDALARAARKEGRGDWLAGLPALVARVADGWQVEVGLPFLSGGGTAWVAPACDDAGRDLVLKVCWLPGTQLRASAPAEYDLVIAGLLSPPDLAPALGPGRRSVAVLGGNGRSGPDAQLLPDLSEAVWQAESVRAVFGRSSGSIREAEGLDVGDVATVTVELIDFA